MSKANGSERSLPRTLTIAGSDSGGGAGIQADLKTFTSLGTYGLSVITALTSQNTQGVDGIQGVEAEFVAKQLRSVVSDIGVDALKMGMLFNAEIITAISQTMSSLFPNSEYPPIVIDPVMVSTSGHVLLDKSAITNLKTDLCPLATVLTPNIPEAAILGGVEPGDIGDLEGMKDACRKIAKLGCKNVLLKGGHLSGKGEKVVYDVLYDGSKDDFKVFEHEMVNTKNTHGTGCTLSAALTAYIAQGHSVNEAVQLAIDYVQGAMLASVQIGKGSGPLNHLFNIIPRALPQPSDLNPYPFTDYMINANQTEWREFTRTHPFVLGIQDGSLAKEKFVHFLRQDYIFLVHYARIHSLMAYKCDTMEEIDATTDIVKHIIRESKLHIERCKAWGITEQDFFSTPESNHTVAYTRYVVDVGLAKSNLHLRVATAPCLLGYGEVGKWLYNDPKTKREGNPYWAWIEEYNGDDFQTAVKIGRNLLESTVKAAPISPSMLEELSQIFGKATRLECGFWTMGWTQT